MPDRQYDEQTRRGELVLVLGGARSGKSTAAERMARDGQRVLFIATAEPGDEGMRRRIGAHRRYRPSHWDTLEEPVHLTTTLLPVVDRYDTFVLDCLTLWVSNLLLDDAADTDPEPAVLQAVERLLDAIGRAGGRWILVSNEVGQGVVPASQLGRTYRDLLGWVNQRVASRADRVYLMVAGLPLELKAPADRAWPDASART